MRIIFFGTPEIAVPCLERLIAGPHDVVGVVSQPDRGRGRGRKVSPSPVSQLALEAEIPLLRPTRVAEVFEDLRRLEPDIGVVVAFGQFIPKSIRELPKAGFLMNAHASLLPHYRGAAPIARAIMAGEERTGISVMRVEREMDTGAVALSRELEIRSGENAEQLSERLAVVAADAIEAALEMHARGNIEWVEQDPSLASLAPKLDRRDGILDWSQPAVTLVCRIHALAPKPGAQGQLDGETLRILAATSEPGACDAAPGTLYATDSGALRVATGEGWLIPQRVQRAGGKAMDTDAFLRGRPITSGARFEPAEASLRPAQGLETERKESAN
jgi:methionyl-tRNA formyltransferase